jgi:putative sterol carrier protein
MYKAGTKEWDENYAKLVEERKKTESEPYTVLTPEWVSEFEKKKADPNARLKEDFLVLMDLWHGECHSVKIVSSEVGRKGDYVLEADYDRWKRVLKKELNVVKELATNKLKLVPFNFKKAAKIAAAAQASLRLVELSGQVSDKFPDELESEEFESFKALLKQLKTDFGI